MKEQNYKNHSRFLILWHIITTLLLLSILITSIYYLVNAVENDLYPAILFVCISVALLIFFGFIRWFPLRAQDRAIRAEENLRHYILTGKPHDKRLRLGQIIALRFASDEEMPGLAKRAISENLSGKQIKLSIKNWQADHHRV